MVLIKETIQHIKLKTTNEVDDFLEISSWLFDEKINQLPLET